MNTLRLLTSAAFAVCMFAANPIQADHHEKHDGMRPLTGSVIILGSSEDLPQYSENQPAEINPNGLVIVQINDIGSVPVEGIKVADVKGLKHLGNVRGVSTSNGKPLMGGGYTWCLFQAGDSAQSGNVEVTFKSAGFTGGEAHTEKYKVTIRDNG